MIGRGADPAQVNFSPLTSVDGANPSSLYRRATRQRMHVREQQPGIRDDRQQEPCLIPFQRKGSKKGGLDGCGGRPVGDGL